MGVVLAEKFFYRKKIKASEHIVKKAGYFLLKSPLREKILLILIFCLHFADIFNYLPLPLQKGEIRY